MSDAKYKTAAPYVTLPSGEDASGGEMLFSQSDDQFMYKMNNKRRGIFLLINNRYFDKNTLQNERSGTDIDEGKLSESFKALDFEVRVKNNQTCAQMMEHMRKVGGDDHTSNDCFVCAILSHGDEEGNVYGKDGRIGLHDLVEPFKRHNCPSLVGKPKIFIIQACRGYKYDDGVPMVKADSHDPSSTLEECRENLASIEMTDSDSYVSDPTIKIQVPQEYDSLYAFSTVPGYYSFRNSKNGSWFIQALTRVLDEYGQTKEIMWMLTRTNHIIAFEKEESKNKKKQVSQMVSMLTKELYFKPKSTVR